MAEIGQIGKPEAAGFAGKRKLYCLPNVFSFEGAPEEYRALVGKYWDEGASHLGRLESAGKVRKVFCEGVWGDGEKALDMLRSMNEPAFQIVKKKLDEGATLLPIEREEIFGPLVDWRNCIHVVRTLEVYKQIFEFYSELSERRMKFILHVVDSNLLGDEAGLLIMTDEDRVKLQFPADIEVFLVTPPTYDDILRWMRDRMKEIGRPAET